MDRKPSPRRVALAFTAALGMAASAPAQAVRPAGADSPPEPPAQEPVELSPFEVRDDKDTGYAAQNTTAGSRLNTSLVDTPAAISVFTTQFIEDIGATNVDDLVDYSVNARNNLLDGGNSQMSGGDPIITIRGISSGGGATGAGGRFTNYFPSSFSQDSYNLERAELTRGPNSVLYGLGLPAGGFNVATKRANVLRPLYSVSYRFGSYHQARGSFDVNQPVVRGKLGLRLNAVAEKRNDWHPHAFKNDRRTALATRWQVARGTRVDAEYETGFRRFSTAPQLGMLDSLTAWLTSGRRLDTVAGAAFPANAGLQLLPSGTFLRYDLMSGELYNLQNTSVSAAVGATPGVPLATGEQQRMLADFGLIPRALFLPGPAFGSSNRFNRAMVHVSHDVNRNLSFDLAYNNEYFENHSLNQEPVSGANLQVYADTNALRPDGTPNPHAGQFYTEAISTQQNTRKNSDDYRLSAAYGLDLTRRPGLQRWLGSHRLVALYEFRSEHIVTNPANELVIENPPSTAMPDAGANQLVRRTYFDLNGPVGRMAMADVRQFPVQSTLSRSNNRPVTTAFLPANDPRDTLLWTNTTFFVWQAHLLGDRVVPTIGYRKDRLANFDSTAGRRPAFGPFAQGIRYAIRDATADYGQGITRNQGVVVHPAKWLAFFYNRSSSFSLPARNVRLFPQAFAAETYEPGRSARGVTDDYGVKFPLLRGRIFATLTHYETSANDQARNGNLGTFKNGIPPIWTTLDNAGVLAANGLSLDKLTAPIALAQASAFDNQSRGWEFELTANVTSNWRLILNYSRNDTVSRNTALEIRNYYAANRAFWLQGDRARLVVNGTPGQLAPSANNPADGLTTISESLEQQLTALEDQFVAGDGARATGVPIDAGNLRSTYSFREGLLKGVSGGIGAHWRGQRVLAFTTSNPATRREIRSPGDLTLDGSLAYRRKVELFTFRTELSVQVNVSNLLANDDLVYLSAYPDGRYRTFGIPTPRAWFVTTTIKY